MSPPRGCALTILDGARRLLRRRATATAGRAPTARSRRVAFATTTTAAPPRMRPATGGTRRARRTTAGSPRATAASAVAGRGPGRRSTPAPRQGHAVHSLSRGTDDLREPFDARGSWRREERPRCKRRTRLPSNGDVDPRRARGHGVSLTGLVDDGPRPRRRRRLLRDRAALHGRDSLDWYGEVPPMSSRFARAPCRHRGPGARRKRPRRQRRLLRDRVASHGRGKVGVEHAADALSWTHESTPPSSPGSAGYHGRGDADGFCENGAA